MTYSSTNPAALLIERFSSTTPRFFVYASTHASTDLSLLPATTSSSTTGGGIFSGCGEFDQDHQSICVRIGDVLINISKATQATTNNLAALPEQRNSL